MNGTNGLTNGSGPPPSTLAAQIVDNLQQSNGRDADGSSLQSLLGDFLSAGSAAFLDTTIDTKCQLVDLLLKACRQTQRPSNPFDASSDQNDQSVKALKVVKLAVKHSPDILALARVAEGVACDGSPHRSPFLLTMLPQVVTFLGDNGDRTISDAACDILTACQTVQTKPACLRLGYRPVTAYLQGCLRALLGGLWKLSEPGFVNLAYRTTFASDETRSGMLTEPAMQAIFDKLHLNPVQAVCVSARLLQMTVSNARDAFGKASLYVSLLEDAKILTQLLLSTPFAKLTPQKCPSVFVYLLETLRRLTSFFSEAPKTFQSFDQSTSCLCSIAQHILREGSTSLHSTLETEFCWVMHSCLSASQVSRSTLIVLAGHFKRLLQPTVEKPRNWTVYGTDLQLTFMMVASALLDLRTVSDSSVVDRLQDEELRNAITECLGNSASRSIDRLSDSQRPAKKARLNRSASVTVDTEPRQLLLQTLSQAGVSVSNAETCQLKPDAWKALTQGQDAVQTQIFNLVDSSICRPTTTPGPKLKCTACSPETGSTRSDRFTDQEFLDNTFVLVMHMVTVHGGQSNPLVTGLIPRIRAMHCLRKLLAHSRNPAHFDLSSPTGKWCLHSLGSRNKNIRLAAGKLIKEYVRPCSDHEVERRNRITALDSIRHLTDGKSRFKEETSMWVLGQIADASPGEDEMLVVIFRLVEYLGHPHPLVNALAYAELLRLSGSSPYRAQKLLEPYWRFIAVSLVKDMVKRPSAVQRLCDLTEIPVEKLLVMTKTHTIPTLVLLRRTEVIERIAAAAAVRNDEEGYSAIVDVCMNAEQLPSLLALLLMHASTEPSAFITATMTAISDDFARTNISDLVKSDPVKIAFEIFRQAGDGDEKRVDQTQNAIGFIAEQSQSRQSSSGRRASRKLDSVGTFFESHSLAVLKLLSDIVTEVHCPQILPERKRCLVGIKHMIKVGGNHIVGAVPQISACLRSAIRSNNLCEEGFAAWTVLIKALTDMSGLIEPTFALIQYNWKRFSATTEKRAQDLLTWLFAERQDLMRESITFLPSLRGIALLSKFETDIAKCKDNLDLKQAYTVFAERLDDEDPLVISMALTELQEYLELNQEYLQSSSLSESPDPVVAKLLQALLDACVRFSSLEQGVAIACAKCLGLIGCLDTNRVELSRTSRQKIVASNFANLEETIDFITFFLEEILVKAFLASMSPRSQNFLGFAMQSLLEICGFRAQNIPRGLDESQHSENWMSISEDARAILTPFLNSRYTLLEGNAPLQPTYPIFAPGKRHAEWLRELVYDLLRKTHGDNATVLFNICKRIVRGQDISIASFLLPYVTLNVLIGDDLRRKQDIAQEFLTVLLQPIEGLGQGHTDELILCSQEIFATLDYFSLWTHKRKHQMAHMRLSDAEKEEGKAAVRVIETVTNRIPAEAMSRRAVECKNFSRGLFYWEQYIRQWQSENGHLLKDDPQSSDFLYQRLQEIYVQIDEPDGIEGVSSFLQALNAEQQVLEYRKAGRWTAVQDWNELLLADEPDNINYQNELLISLRESGQYEALINLTSASPSEITPSSLSMSSVIEACWSTSKWDRLVQCIESHSDPKPDGFVPGVGGALVMLYQKRYEEFESIIEDLRIELSRGLSKSSTMTLQSCRGTLLHLHALTEIETIAGIHAISEEPTGDVFVALDRRLNTLGAFPADKQYLLALRRAAMQLSKMDFSKYDISASWLTSARLYRKQDDVPQAFKAILHASKNGDNTAAIEHARLLWKEGHHRRAIQSLEGAIAAHAFEKHTVSVSFDGDQTLAKNTESQKKQNIMAAKAQLLRAKWVDRAGQTQSESIIRQYQEACSLYTRWEKGQYSLGRHYNKLLESERLKEPAKQSQTCITGELAKHVIENYLRSMAYGAKYIHQTLPRILTLWCELGTVVDQPLDAKYGTDDSFRSHVMKHRKNFFEGTVSQLKKYIDRLPAFVFYTALNQICARICHTNARVYAGLADIVVKVCVAHPQQALWTLFAMVRSTSKDRMQRGQACVAKVQEHAKKLRNEGSAAEIKLLISQGTKIVEQLLEVCNADIRRLPKRQHKVNIRELGFNQKQAPACRLVIPVETTLTARLPTAADTVNMRQHKAFGKETITIQSFQDEVLLLSSLVRPRKVEIRGSDGRVYGLLCKPRDDLRLDQRLLEFNATIKRLLKKDAESTKRRLYVKTYAVTPLNEECGLIEWVEGLKTHRDILLKIYSSKGITPNYNTLHTILEEAVSKDLTKFTDVVMGMFPPVFHEWFVETFPDPDAWYTARLRYTRSCAVMSMVGHVLGLGDRHSENIMIEEGNGGIMHVDFNCLFDKGLTFEKPEQVPFRLTANMVDAFGAYGYEGPFRTGCELTMAILRQHEDTLMTVLEQFLYDPTLELMGNRKRKANADVPNTPEGVLESVRNKVRGLLPKETIPLSVEGHVEYLVQRARDPMRLASMYIGWCSFL